MTALLAERPTTWGEGLPTITGAYPQAVTVWTDMPAGLTERERNAYVRGYSRGCLTFVRKHGGPGVSGDELATVTREQMTERRLEHESTRHPAAHRSGLSALRSFLKVHGTEERAAELLKSSKPRKLAAVPDAPAVEKPARKPRARKAKVAPVDAVSAAVESGRLSIVRVPGEVEVIGRFVTADAPTYPEVRAARKAARRELAEAMRAAGIKPTGDAWENAKREAGLS